MHPSVEDLRSRSKDGAGAWYRETLANAARKGRTLEAHAWLGLNDLFYLLVRLLRRPDINNDWLYARCREVEADPNGRLDLWAREHRKSSIITFGLTIQDVLKDPEITVGIFSHTRPMAKTFLAQIKREMEQNDALKLVYPKVLWSRPEREAPRWSEDSGIVVRRKGNPKESTIEAWGLVDGQPTSRHFRLMVYDDVISRESVTSPEMIRKSTDAWDLSQNLSVEGGWRRYIGTRYNLADTYAEMMRRGAAIPRVHPATHNGRLDGEPVLFSREEWANRKRDSSRAILAAQMLQNPMADEDASFRPEWLRSYEVRPRTLNVYVLCDPSRGRNAESDNTAIAVLGLASNGAKFLLDGYCHRMTLFQRWIALRTMYHKWSRAQGVMAVRVGYERFGMQSDDEYFQEQMLVERKRRIENAVFNITELNWPREGGSSKRERGERLEPDFRNSRFYLPLVVTREGKSWTWRVQSDPEQKGYGEVEYLPLEGPTSQQARALEGGSADLLARPLRQRDQDGRAYDLTLHFIEEYLTFPFGAYKDLIDASSRIYDMEPVSPVVINPADTEPVVYWDR